MPESEGALGAMFRITRALQCICMVAIIGMTSNFVAHMVAAGATPPSMILAILGIICIGVLYCVISIILYLDSLLPFLINAIADGAFLITVVVLSVVAGRPLSYLDCTAIGQLYTHASSSNSFASALGSSLTEHGGMNYRDWIGTSKATCYEMKSIWGLCVALCILFFLSSICSLCMWKRNKQRGSGKGEA